MGLGQTAVKESVPDPWGPHEAVGWALPPPLTGPGFWATALTEASAPRHTTRPLLCLSFPFHLESGFSHPSLIRLVCVHVCVCMCMFYHGPTPWGPTLPRQTGSTQIPCAWKTMTRWAQDPHVPSPLLCQRLTTCQVGCQGSPCLGHTHSSQHPLYRYRHPRLGGSVGQRLILTCLGCGFEFASGQIQELTNVRIKNSRKTRIDVSLSLPVSFSKKINQ